jgi:hypothetical protein
MLAYRIAYWLIAIFTAYVVYKITDKNGLDGPFSSLGGCVLCGVIWPGVWLLILSAVVVKGPKHVWSRIKTAWVLGLLICFLLPMSLKAEYIYSDDIASIKDDVAAMSETLKSISAKLSAPKDEHKGMKPVVEYRMVCNNQQAGLSNDITILLAQGWELYSAPTSQPGYDEVCQAMTKTTWVKK